MDVSANTSAQLAEIVDDVINVANYRVFPVILESMLFAVYAVLMVLHCIKYRYDQARVISIFAISVCLFVMCAASWALDVCIASLELYQLIPSRSSPGGTAVPISDATKAVVGDLAYARNFCGSIILIFCDTISLWRTYVIYGRPRWLKVASCSLFILSAITYIMNVALRMGSEVANPPPFAVQLFEFSRGALLLSLGSISRGSTALAQLCTTILIARKAVVYRKEINNLMPAQHGPRQFQRPVAVLYVIIETGIIYSLIWVVFFISNDYGFGDTGEYWSDYWICQLSGIYPTLIVVVVSQRSSILEQAHVASSLVSAPIGFAVNTDVEASPASAFEKDD